MNPLPVTVKVVEALPAVALEGESEASVGTGLGAGLIVNVWALDVPPPGVGLCTVTLAVPAEARSVAGTCAVSEVLET
jgi:hypothetical protein